MHAPRPHGWWMGIAVPTLTPFLLLAGRLYGMDLAGSQALADRFALGCHPQAPSTWRLTGLRDAAEPGRRAG